MNRKTSVRLLTITAVLALAACAATGPPQPSHAAAAAPASYKRVVRNGVTLYCRKEMPTGTRFVEETCLTQAQMDAQQKNAQGFTDDVHGMTVLPPTSPNVR
jgi:hypothetical protein